MQLYTPVTPAPAGPPARQGGGAYTSLYYNQWGAEPVLPFSRSRDQQVSRGGGRASFSYSCRLMTDEGEYEQLSCPRPLLAGSPAPLPRGSALLRMLPGGGEQCQFCHSRDVKARSPTHHRLGGAGNGRGLLFLAHSTAWKMRTGPDLRYAFMGQITCAPVNKVSATLLPGRGTGPSPLSAAASEGQSCLSCSCDPHDQLRQGMSGKGVVSLPCSCR